jgi:hypothetical protein
VPPTSNEKYGGGEGTLIQENGDPASDLLYTMNFAFIGLHEAYAATGEAFYKEATDRIARFLVRAQVHSEVHPQFHGAWYRAFDFKNWDYWQAILIPVGGHGAPRPAGANRGFLRCSA